MGIEGFGKRKEKITLAGKEVENEIEQRCAKMEGGATLENKISVLRELLQEYGAVKPGTNMPVDNSRGPYAEVAAEMLFKLEAEKDFLEKIGNPADDNTLAVARVAA